MLNKVSNLLIVPYLGLPLVALFQLVTNTDTDATGDFIVLPAMLLGLAIGVGRGVARQRNGGSLASDRLWKPLRLVWGALILAVIGGAWMTNR